MAMQFETAVALPTGASAEALRLLFAFVEFMRGTSLTSSGSPGWTVSRSSDGTTGGVGDNISAYTDLSQYNAGVSESWFVLRAPDGSKEFCWYRTTTNDLFWGCAYSPTGAFAGGDAGNRATAADEEIVHPGDLITFSSSNVFHAGADDAAPYGWWLYSHLTGALGTARAAMAFIPITNSQQPGEVDPYVFFYDGGSGGGFTKANFTSETAPGASGGVRGFVPGSTFTTIPALGLKGVTSDVWPDNCAQDSAGADVLAPVAFGRAASLAAPQGFKGYSDFVQWNGVARTAGETFAAKTRISVGAVSFPWDGVTTPSAT